MGVGVIHHLFDHGFRELHAFGGPAVKANRRLSVGWLLRHRPEAAACDGTVQSLHDPGPQRRRKGAAPLRIQVGKQASLVAAGEQLVEPLSDEVIGRGRTVEASGLVVGCFDLEAILRHDDAPRVVRKGPGEPSTSRAALPCHGRGRHLDAADAAVRADILLDVKRSGILKRCQCLLRGRLLGGVEKRTDDVEPYQRVRLLDSDQRRRFGVRLDHALVVDRDHDHGRA